MDQPNFQELLRIVNEGAEEDKRNCSLGLFVSEYLRDEEDVEKATNEVEELIVKKPVVAISRFIEDNEVFYNIELRFRSYDDADYKQVWALLARFADKAKREAMMLEADAPPEKLTVFSFTIVPDVYNGKYYFYVHMPFTEFIQRTENAFDKTATISFLCDEAGFQGLIADDEVVDPRSIEDEVRFEAGL